MRQLLKDDHSCDAGSCTAGSHMAASDMAAQPSDGANLGPVTIPAGPAIVFLNRFFYPDETATSQLLTDLAFDLAAQGRLVRVITSRLQSGHRGLLARSEVAGNLEIYRVASRAQFRSGRRWKLLAYLSFYPSAFVALLRYLHKGDLVVAKTDPPLIVLVAWVAALLKRAEVISWMQDLYPEVAIELKAPLFSGRALGALLTGIRNFALKNACANVVIGNLMASKLNAQGIAAETIRVIPNWVDDQAIQPMPTNQSQMRKTLKIGPDTFVVGYSGNLGRAHEFETVLGAATLLKQHDVCFLFIGGGYANDLLRKAVSERGLTNFVFKPPQPRERLADSLAAPDVHWLSLRPELEGLIVPSKFYGILASGRPVITVGAASGEIASEVRKHGCGFVVEPGECQEFARKIEFLASNRDVCVQTGKLARTLSVSLFSKQSALAAWSEVFASFENSGGYSPYHPVLSLQHAKLTSRA